MSTSSTKGRKPNPALDRQRSRDSGLLEAVLTSAGIGCLAGAIAGFLWGGIGGRIAMRVVFLTSNDSVRGLTSDDGFEIGKISGATILLLIFTTILGAIAGFLYGLLRMVTAGPTWAVAAADPTTECGPDLVGLLSPNLGRGCTHSPVRHVTDSENNVSSNGILRQQPAGSGSQSHSACCVGGASLTQSTRAPWSVELVAS